MKSLSLLLPLCAGLLPAATITNVTITNLSTASYANQGANGQIEFQSSASFIPPSNSGGLSTLSSALQWLFAARSENEVTAPAVGTVQLGYEITFTVEDPANAGYLLSVESTLNGWHTAQWLSGDIEAFGGYIADFTADVSREGVYANAPNLLLPGGMASASIDLPESNDPVTSYASAFAAVLQFGTATYSLRYSSPLAFVGTSGPAGEMALRYGLQPTLNGFAISGTPGPDGEPADTLGLFTTITMLSFDAPADPGSDVPEPGTFALAGAALVTLARLRKK